MEKLGPLMEAAIEVLGDDFPVTATTLIGVAALFEPDYLIEIDVTAVVTDGSSLMDFETVRYETDGQIATITLNRPEAANAQNTQMIEDIDAAFDSAEADDEVRVVILAAEGKHFSSGHDLKEILRGEEHWAAMRATPEGKLAPRAGHVLGQAHPDPRLPARSRSPRCRARARPPG